MTTSRPDPARVIAASIDTTPSVSAETILKKFWVRWKLFTACALIVPAVAVGLGHLVPTNYKSSAQILIRHQGGGGVLYGDFITGFSTISGASTAEVMRSDPIVSQMVEAVGVEDADIARASYKVLFGYAAKLIMPLFGRDKEDAAVLANPKLKYTFLAKELKSSIEVTTLMMERSSSSARDELIEVNLKSTNPARIASMTNTLCEVYVAEVNRQAKSEILAARDELAKQASALQAEVTRLMASPEKAPDAGVEISSAAEIRPVAAGMARTLSELELRLVELRQVYRENAPEVEKAARELERARALLGNQEAVDAANRRLSQLTKRMESLSFTARLHEAGQGPLSIVERALPPKKTKLILVMKYGVPAAGGLVAGIGIGLVAVFMLSLFDPRLFIAADVPAETGLPLLGVLPKPAVKAPAFAALADLPAAESRPALLQLLARLDVLPKEQSRVILICSAANEAASATVALQLSALLSRERESGVLLIDANFDRPVLSSAAEGAVEGGLLDVLAGQVKLEQAQRPTKLPRLTFLAAGRPALRDDVGSLREIWPRLLGEALKTNKVIVVHAGGLIDSRETAQFAREAGSTLIVTSRSVSKKPALKTAAALLASIGAPVAGVIHCDAKS